MIHAYKQLVQQRQIENTVYKYIVFWENVYFDMQITSVKELYEKICIIAFILKTASLDIVYFCLPFTWLLLYYGILSAMTQIVTYKIKQEIKNYSAV